MSQSRPIPFDHIGYRKVTERLRKAEKRELDKSVIGFCDEVALFRACGDDLVVLRGALAELVDLFADTEFFAQAFERGRAATGWYKPEEPDTSVEGLLVSTQEVPGVGLATLLEADGFHCVSAEGARPLIYLGKGNLAVFKASVRSSDKVVRYDPPGGIVVARAPLRDTGDGGDPKAPASAPVAPEARPSGAATAATLSRSETTPADDAVGIPAQNIESEIVNGYRIATVDRPSGQAALPTTPVEVLAVLVEEIVAIEGPMDEDLIVRRVRSAYGQSSIRKAGRETLTGLIEELVEDDRLDQDEAGFYTMPGTFVVARSRLGIEDDLVRATAHLPPAEVRAAIAELLRDRPDLAGRDLIIETAARLGFRLAAAQVTDGPLGALICAEIAKLEASRDPAKSGDTILGGDDDDGHGAERDDLPRAA